MRVLTQKNKFLNRSFNNDLSFFMIKGKVLMTFLPFFSVDLCINTILLI